MPRPAARCCSSPAASPIQIYDQTGIDLFRHGRDYPATNVEAPTLAELAEKIGIEPEPFLRTIEELQRRLPHRRRLHAGRTRRQGHRRHHAEEIELGDADREGPVPRLSDHRRRHLQLRRHPGRHPGARDQHLLRADQGAVTPPATSSGCSFTTTRPAPGRPATPCSAISPAGALARCWAGTDIRVSGGHIMAKAHAAQGPRAIEKLAEWVLAIRARGHSGGHRQPDQAPLLDTIGCGFAAFEEEGAAAVLADARRYGRRAAMHGARQHGRRPARPTRCWSTARSSACSTSTTT